MTEYILEMDCYWISCPHCDVSILVKKSDIKCGIFRCGEYKETKLPIPPHLSKEERDHLVLNGKINGCGQPFKFDGIKVSICDYI